MSLCRQTDRGYGIGNQEVSRGRDGVDLVLQGKRGKCGNDASIVGYVDVVVVVEKMLGLQVGNIEKLEGAVRS